MIRFCDKEVYTITTYKQYRKEELISFFLNGHRKDIIVIVSENNTFIGIITYKSVLQSEMVEEMISREYVVTSKNIFMDAKEILKNDTKSFLPVINNNMELQGFCYEDGKNYIEWTRAFKSFKDNFYNEIDSFKLMYPQIQQFCIYDINEWAYEIYLGIEKARIPVCVIGEKWNWVGVDTLVGFGEYPDYSMFKLYAEGNSSLKEELDNRPSLFSEVIESFRDVLNLQIGLSISVNNTVKIKLQSISKHIYDFIIPKLGEIDYCTELEEISRYCSLSNWAINGKVSEFERKNFIALYGKRNCQIIVGLHDTQDNTDRISWNEGGLELFSYRKKQNSKRIYLVGACIVRGYNLCKEESLVYKLQERLKKSVYAVVGVIMIQGDTNSMKCLTTDLQIREDDYILFIDNTHDKDVLRNSIHLTNKYNDQNRASWFSDHPIHTNGMGNDMISSEIYKHLLNIEDNSMHNYIQKGEALGISDIKRIQKYIAENALQQYSNGNNGAIVMNCNPFTYGHKYLIDYASSRVDNLFIFVVEENKSEFVFEDRFKMVQDGTKDLENVHVIPSGEFIISNRTFSSYFTKESIQEEIIDASEDIEIFARYIAPGLHIQYRFVGEEPTDKITAQYNNQLKELLKEFDINLVEIPRKSFNGKYIYATEVRRLYHEKEYDQLVNLVPETTLSILRRLKND